MSAYAEFLKSKQQISGEHGFAAKWIPDSLFDFQGILVEWSLRRGRAALFEDCGLGKTAQQLVWAENVCRHTNRPVLVLTPIAVASQTVSEGKKFGVEVVRSHRGWTGNQIENKYSHWIWRRYASAFWDDVRIERTLPYREARDAEDERHMHPLQLDVIERTVVLRTNPGEVVFTPFMGVGSEVYGAVINGRRGIGVELKPSYYRQAVTNLAVADDTRDFEQLIIPGTNEELEASA